MSTLQRILGSYSFSLVKSASNAVDFFFLQTKSSLYPPCFHIKAVGREMHYGGFKSSSPEESTSAGIEIEVIDYGYYIHQQVMFAVQSVC